MATYEKTKEFEDQLNKLRESYRASVNWTEHAKWIEAGKPYEEHEEVLLFLKQNEPTNSKTVGKSLIYVILIYMLTTRTH